MFKYSASTKHDVMHIIAGVFAFTVFGPIDSVLNTLLAPFAIFIYPITAFQVYFNIGEANVMEDGISQDDWWSKVMFLAY